MRMVERGEINEAENILADGMEEGDMEYFQRALMFYDRLTRNPMSSWKSTIFQKQEVLDGVKYAVRIMDMAAFSALFHDSAASFRILN